MMPHQTDRPSCEFQLSVFSSLIFRHVVAFLLLTHTHGGQSQQVGQHLSVVAMVGDDVTLPCRVNPAQDAVNVMLEWMRPDLTPRFVHVRRFGKDHLVDQNPTYKGRTSASMDGLKQGDMSLKLSKVHFSDEGTYRCLVRELNTDSSVQLVVDVVIEVTEVSSGVLQCKSEGWYPQPEVSWLDAEGNVLSAGPTETARGSDGLYAVSSRVTVEKRHGNTFTCRVQQKNINQTRETRVHVPDDFFTDSPCSSAPASIAIGLIVGVMFTLAVAFVVWRLRQHENAKKHHVDEGTPRGGDPEKQSLIEGTMKNQNGTEDGNNTQSLSNETRCQVGAETQPEKLNTEGLTGRQEDRQSEHAGSGSQCVTESGRQRHEVQAGGQTVNDLDKRDERIEKTEPEKREKKPEKEEDRVEQEEDMKSLKPQREGLMDGGGQQQTGDRGEATHGNEDNQEQTEGGGTQNETETKSTKEKDTVSPDKKTQSAVNMSTGQTPTAGEIKQEEEKTRNELDNREDERKTDPPSPKQEIESVNPEEAAQSLMDEGGQQQTNGDKANGEDTTVKENTIPQCPTAEAGGDTDENHDDKKTKSPNSTRAGKDGEGGQRTSEEPKTDTPPEKLSTEGHTERQEDRQSEHAGSGSQCVTDKRDQRTEETKGTDPEKEEDRVKPEEEAKSSNPQKEGQGLMDGGGQQHTGDRGQATHDNEDNQEHTHSTNNRPEGEGQTRQNNPPAGGGTKSETETKSTKEKVTVCPDKKTQSAVNMSTGQTPTAGEIKQDAQAEEKTRKHETGNKEKQKEQKQGQRQDDPPAGDETKNETESKSTEGKVTACPDEGEGQQQTNRDKANGEDTTVKENTTPQCPTAEAEDDTDENHDDKKTKSANNTRAGKDGEGGQRTSEEPKTDTPPEKLSTEGQTGRQDRQSEHAGSGSQCVMDTPPEKSPDSRDVDEDIKPPGGQRDVDRTEETCQTEA